MKRVFLFSMVMMAMSFLQFDMSWAVIKFADEAIKTDFEKIFKKYELIQKLYAQLSSSELTYVIRYGEKVGHIEGSFKTDGKNLYITLKKYGKFSLQAKFAHEAAHALQFEQGKIGFVQNSNREWKPINLNIWDEAEAFQMMIPVADGIDLNGNGDDYTPTNLYQFKRKLEDFGIERAAQWLSLIYPGLSLEQQNNPMVSPEVFQKIWAKRENKLYKDCKFYYIPYQSQLAYTN